MDIKKRLGRVLKYVMKSGALGHLRKGTWQVLGASYYNRLSGSQKRNYHSLMYDRKRDRQRVLRDFGILAEKPNEDPHIGGEAWAQAIKGGLPLIISAVKEILSPNYWRSETFGFPDIMKGNINKLLGWYTKDEHFKALSLYQVNKSSEDMKKVSRARRYDDKGVLKQVPMSKKGLAFGFKFLDNIRIGYDRLKLLSPIEQHLLLVQALPANTLSGYPDFDHQTKDNITQKAEDEALKLGYRRLGKALDPETNKMIKVLTVDWIDGLINHVSNRKKYFPFVGLYRTHFEKLRGVFGAFMILKLMGLVVSVSKALGFTKEAMDAANLPYNEDVFDTEEDQKKIFSPGRVPFMSQLGWDKQFKIILDKLPPLTPDGSEVQRVSDSWIFEKFGIKLKPGDYDLNCVGEDFSKYDTGITPDDLRPFAKHNGWGPYITYVLDCMKYSKVWIGGHRVSDILYKSGIPFTAILGTLLHQNIIYLYEEWAAKQEDIIDKPIILGAIVQSDDSLIYGININLKDISRMCSEFGFIMNPEDSVDFKKDKIVTFLQVHCGAVLAGTNRYTCVGNPQSKYVKLAHSEREIKPQNNNSGALVGIWKITEDEEVDAGLSKLASFWVDLLPLVELILMIGKNTPYGMKLLAAIEEMKKNPKRRYEPYRPDVIAGLDPMWLTNLDIRRIRFSDRVAAALATA